VPDTSLLIATSKRLTESGHGDVAMAVDGLLTHQQASGGFPLSVGFSDLFDEKLLPCRPEVKRWRDCLPTPNWNSWVFWHLSEALETGVRLPPPRTEYPFVLTTDKEEREGPYTITDDGSAVTFKSQDGVLKGLFVKQHDAPLVCNIQERDEGFRLRMRLQRYPSLARRAIFAGADLFG
jgi:hypothetical protein